MCNSNTVCEKIWEYDRKLKHICICMFIINIHVDCFNCTSVVLYINLVIMKLWPYVLFLTIQYKMIKSGSLYLLIRFLPISLIVCSFDWMITYLIPHCLTHIFPNMTRDRHTCSKRRIVLSCWLIFFFLNFIPIYTISLKGLYCSLM